MPPKTLAPGLNPLTRHNAAVASEARVHGLLHHRAYEQAQRAIEQGFQHATLAHLPLRVGFTLLRLNADGIARMIARGEQGQPIVYSLLSGIDPRHPEAVAVGVAETQIVLGFLSPEALGVLSRAGEYAHLYEPRFLALVGVDGAGPRLQMELVRPDLRQCSACEKLHTGEHENCHQCRGKRRRKSLSLEETRERAPVPLNNALRHLISCQEN